MTAHPGLASDPLSRGLGSWTLAERPLPQHPTGRIPVFRQVLDARVWSVGFEPGTRAYEALANDQNRFAAPRSLPPLIDLSLPGEDPDDAHAFVVTRYAYTEGAFHLLEELLEQGHVFGLAEFVAFAATLADALAWLHEHGIVHGQWNVRSVFAIPDDGDDPPFGEAARLRYEVVNSGVSWADPAAVPEDLVRRGYFPPEVFLAPGGAPDFGALDRTGDVFCFCAFLKDLMQRACSSEELPSQAARILEQVHKEANRRGEKATPEAFRRKEMEIVDHLHTIKVHTESFIQDGLRARDQRATAAELRARIARLHGTVERWFRALAEQRFAPVDVFGDDLLHYTTFSLGVSPARVSRVDDTTVTLTGRDLPQDLVRVTLNERHEGIEVVGSTRDRLEFRVLRGFPTGSYRVSINNRRTDGVLEVYEPRWHALEPREVHQPWEGFGNVTLVLTGEELPPAAQYALQRDGAADDGATVAAVVVSTAQGPVDAGEDVRFDPTDRLELTFPCDTPVGGYGLLVNGLATGLTVTVQERLPEPELLEVQGAEAPLHDHRAHELVLIGRDFHPAMVVAVGAGTPRVELVIEDPGRATLRLPRGFPAGRHELRLNHRPTGHGLEVVAAAWEPRAITLRLGRSDRQPPVIELQGRDLPALQDGGYVLVGRHGRPDRSVPRPRAEELEPGHRHRLRLPPNLRRGRHRLRFADVDTGVDLRIRRPVPRAVAVAAAGASVLALAALAFLAHDRLAPRIESIETPRLLAFGTPELRLRGRRLRAIEVLLADGTPRRLPAEAAGDGAYRVAASGLPPARYVPRALGRFFDAAEDPANPGFEVVEPTFELRPSTVHRHTDTGIEIAASEALALDALGPLGLVAADGRVHELAIEHGGVRLPALALPAGRYRAVLGARTLHTRDGAPVELSVVGPQVTAVHPDPVTLGEDGVVRITVEGRHLSPDTWLGLAPEPEDAEPIALVRDGESLVAEAAPGTFTLLAGPDRERAEPLGRTLAVLPPPRVLTATPLRLEPDVPTELVLEGVNLEALDALRLIAADAEARGTESEVRVDLAEAPVEATETADATLERRRVTVTLASGTWALAPSDGALRLEVYDDCVRAFDAFVAGAAPDDLVERLASGRPTPELRVRAADLMFDRGHFAAARAVYASVEGLRARLRAALVTAFLDDEPVPIVIVPAREAESPYAAALEALGFTGAAPRPFDAAGPLAWELEFVRGHTARDPEVAVAALEASIAHKRRVAGELEHAPFHPAVEELPRRRLELASAALAAADAPRARELFERLLADAASLAHLSPEERALAAFAGGHLRAFYAGDESGAAELLERARTAGAGFTRAASTYLRALEVAVDPAAAADGPAADAPGGAWALAFATVLDGYRRVVESPNFDLLAPDDGPVLPAAARAGRDAFRDALEALKRTTPLDPLAHHALLHLIASARAASWPREAHDRAARAQRERLAAIGVPDAVLPLKRFYLAVGDYAGLDLPQITVLTRAERDARADTLEEIAGTALPDPFRERLERLKRRFTGPSVEWWRSR